MKTIVSIIAAVLFATAPAFAYQNTPDTIDKIKIYENGFGGVPETYYIRFSNHNMSTCNGSATTMIRGDNPQADRIFSLVLAAHLSGKKVVAYNASNTDCLNNYPVAMDIWIQN